ncbi:MULTISPECIES: hypothetical protein [unclassified Nocardioides]|nr:hypothetical protein [Nocardioides sp. Arc9.136]WKN50522.1 hypothetical protein OSR43_10425 [Nocardioides sp. Arc9.136]
MRVTVPARRHTPEAARRKDTPVLKILLIVLVVLAILYVASMLLRRR